jgi:hypothetical protein
MGTGAVTILLPLKPPTKSQTGHVNLSSPTHLADKLSKEDENMQLQQTTIVNDVDTPSSKEVLDDSTMCIVHTRRSKRPGKRRPARQSWPSCNGLAVVTSDSMPLTSTTSQILDRVMNSTPSPFTPSYYRGGRVVYNRSASAPSIHPPKSILRTSARFKLQKASSVGRFFPTRQDSNTAKSTKTVVFVNLDDDNADSENIQSSEEHDKLCKFSAEACRSTKDTTSTEKQGDNSITMKTKPRPLSRPPVIPRRQKSRDPLEAMPPGFLASFAAQSTNLGIAEPMKKNDESVTSSLPPAGIPTRKESVQDEEKPGNAALHVIDEAAMKTQGEESNSSFVTYSSSIGELSFNIMDDTSEQSDPVSTTRKTKSRPPVIPRRQRSRDPLEAMPPGFLASLAADSFNLGIAERMKKNDESVCRSLTPVLDIPTLKESVQDGEKPGNALHVTDEVAYINDAAAIKTQGEESNNSFVYFSSSCGELSFNMNDISDHSKPAPSTRKTKSRAPVIPRRQRSRDPLNAMPPGFLESLSQSMSLRIAVYTNDAAAIKTHMEEGNNFVYSSSSGELSFHTMDTVSSSGVDTLNSSAVHRIPYNDDTIDESNIVTPKRATCFLDEAPPPLIMYSPSETTDCNSVVSSTFNESTISEASLSMLAPEKRTSAINENNTGRDGEEVAVEDGCAPSRGGECPEAIVPPGPPPPPPIEDDNGTPSSTQRRRVVRRTTSQLVRIQTRRLKTRQARLSLQVQTQEGHTPSARRQSY